MRTDCSFLSLRTIVVASSPVFSFAVLGCEPIWMIFLKCLA